MKKIAFCKNEEETLALGILLGKVLKKGYLLTLRGDLGAGKTTFVQGIGMGFGIEKEKIVSPTFSIMNVYEVGLGSDKKILQHFDLYRIDSLDELEMTGFYEYIKNKNVANVIEWSDKFPEAIPKEHLEINIEFLNEGRTIELISFGEKYEKLISEVKYVSFRN